MTKLFPLSVIFGSHEKGTFEARTIKDIKQCDEGTSLHPDKETRTGERIILPYETKGIFKLAVNSVKEGKTHCNFTDETLDMLRIKRIIKKVEAPANSMK